METLLQASAIVFIAAFMASVGLDLAPGDLRMAASRRGLWSGLLAALIAVPLATVLLVSVVAPPRAIVVGLVVLSVSAGAPFAPNLATRARGHVPVAVLLTILLGAITPFVAPPLARTLLSYSGEVDIRPLRLIARLVVLQWTPLALGILTRRFRRDLAIGARKVASALVGVAGLVVVGLILARAAAHLAELAWLGVAATLLTWAAAVGLGYLAGGRDADVRRTLAFTLGVPNVGLALLIVSSAAAPRILQQAVVALFLVRAAANLAAIGLLRAGTRRRVGPLPAGPASPAPRPP